MPFGPVDPDLDLVALEERVLARWREHDVIGEVRRLRKDGEPWIFYEGPPTANGRPGLHHVWARVFKDLYPRFQTMRGKNVPRKGGWDCHGLPVELEVEKELGPPHQARDRGLRHRRVQPALPRLGAALRRGLDRAHRALGHLDRHRRRLLDADQRLRRVGLVAGAPDVGQGPALRGPPGHPLLRPLRHGPVVARGRPRATATSSTRRSTCASRSPRVRTAATGADLLVWTTTPWTLISNVAAAVGPDIDLRARSPSPTAGATCAGRHGPPLPRAPRWSSAGPAPTWSAGATSRPFDVLDAEPSRRRALAGRGRRLRQHRRRLGHRPPRPGLRRGRRPGRPRARACPVLNPVDADGAFDHRCRRATGRFVKDADRGHHRRPRAARPARARGALRAHLPPLLALRHPAHLLGQDVLVRPHLRAREPLLRENERIGWHPDHLKHGRFGKWLEGNVDWALVARPLLGHAAAHLALRAMRPRHVHRLGGRAGRAGRPRPVRPRPAPPLRRRRHVPVRRRLRARPGASRPCSTPGSTRARMPSAQHHYPFESAEPSTEAFPADFICEAIDQTRGWFYSLLAVNTLVFDATPYRNVVCLGHIVDEDGAEDVEVQGQRHRPVGRSSTTLGADALRWYFFSAGQPWTPRRVSEDGIREATRQTLLTLWNVFSLLRHLRRPRRLDCRRPSADPPSRRTCSTAGSCRSSTTPSPPSPTRSRTSTRSPAPPASAAFVDDLSNWYVRRSPAPVLEGQRPGRARHAAPVPRHHRRSCWRRSARSWPTSSTPRSPASASVHLADWPEPLGRPTPRWPTRWHAARRLVALGRAARTDAKVKVRQPLRRALLLHPGADARRRRARPRSPPSST